MRCKHALLMLVCAALCSFLLAAPASAQTLVPTDVFAHHHKPGGKPSPPCGHGVTLICAGEKVTKGAANVVGDTAKLSVGAAGDAVMGGIVSWAASGAAWLVSEIGRQIDR